MSILKDIANTIDDAEIFETKKSGEDSDGDDSHAHVERRGRFKFSLIKIPIGSELTFDPTGIKVNVASDDTIEFQDRIYKLSPFVGTFMPEDKRNTSGAYQGAKFFSYKGKILEDLRKEQECSNSI